jgi:hypothetical protein
LEAHFKRDLLTRALFSSDMSIDERKTQKSIAWTLHQLEVRKELWPEDAGGPVERLEKKIVKALKVKGTLSLTSLKDLCHLYRPGSGGHEAFNRAVQALTRSQEITVIGKTRKGSLLYTLLN